MDDSPNSGTRSRDESYHTYELSHAIYGMFPSRAPNTPSPSRSRTNSPVKNASKRKGPADSDHIPPLTIKLAPSASSSSWLPAPKRSRMQRRQMELHQSTCLNLNAASDQSTESDLWILPDFDDWEFEGDAQQQGNTTKEGDWAPLLRRAANSNRERLRNRLEGDGWDFVGGKYGEDEKALREGSGLSEESVDEEFDCVLLEVARGSY